MRGGKQRKAKGMPVFMLFSRTHALALLSPETGVPNERMGDQCGLQIKGPWKASFPSAESNAKKEREPLASVCLPCLSDLPVFESCVHEQWLAVKDGLKTRQRSIKGAVRFGKKGRGQSGLLVIP